MTCIPCQKARQAIGRAVKNAAVGNLPAAKAEGPKLVEALGEKAEAVRVRAKLALRRRYGH